MADEVWEPLGVVAGVAELLGVADGVVELLGVIEGVGGADPVREGVCAGVCDGEGRYAQVGPLLPPPPAGQFVRVHL